MINKYILAFREACKILFNSNILLEMTTLTDKNSNFPFIVDLYSDDHSPKHLHFLSKDKKLLVKIKITESCPKDISEIEGFSWKIPETNRFKKEVLKWFNSLDEDGDIQWKVALNLWNNYHNQN